MRQVRLIAVTLGCLLVGLACGGVGSQHPAAPTSALASWTSFPADQVPRPIVLLDQTPRWPGFTTGDGKVAALCGRVTGVGVTLPPLTASDVKVTWVGGASATYPAADAASALAAVARPAGKQQSCGSVPALAVTSVSLGSADFPTDRGTAHIPSWLFAIAGTTGPMAYPALAQTALWPGQAEVGPQATLSADGRSLTFAFIGAAPGTGRCQAEYTGTVAESATAVAVAPAIVNPPQQGQATGGCTLEGHIRAVTVSLSRPLGSRVVVTASGVAVAVCPPGWKPGSSC